MNKVRILDLLSKASLISTCSDIKNRYRASPCCDQLRLIAMAIVVIIFGGVSYWGGSRIPFFGAIPGFFLGVTFLYFICPAPLQANDNN